jgi:hypothetical protein
MSAKPWKPDGWHERIIAKMLAWKQESINRVSFRIALKDLPHSSEAISASRAHRDRVRRIDQIFTTLAQAGIVKENDMTVRIINRPALQEIFDSKIFPRMSKEARNAHDSDH